MDLFLVFVTESFMHTSVLQLVNEEKEVFEAGIKKYPNFQSTCRSLLQICSTLLSSSFITTPLGPGPHVLRRLGVQFSLLHIHCQPLSSALDTPNIYQFPVAV